MSTRKRKRKPEQEHTLRDSLGHVVASWWISSNFWNPWSGYYPGLPFALHTFSRLPRGLPLARISPLQVFAFRFVNVFSYLYYNAFTRPMMHLTLQVCARQLSTRLGSVTPNAPCVTACAPAMADWL